MPKGVRYVGLWEENAVERIRGGNRTVREICGKQKQDPGAGYRYSTYSLAVPCEEGTLLYHTLTGELVFLPQGTPTEEEREQLIASRFLVPEGSDDRAYAEKVLKIAGMLRPPVRHKTSFTILTTTDCNARCFYCYEIGIRRIPMTEETARAAAAYIRQASGGEPVFLRWFGGEPLYNRRVIDIICGDLREHGAEYESGMVSNGYYLDGETAAHAVRDWHLRKVQITIDGTEKLYNRTKAYIDADENPYARVLNNIRQATEAGIRVTIRLNMDAGNAEDLCRLADDLAARFPEHTNLQVYVALIQKFAGGIHRYDSWAKTEESYFAIRERLKAHGLLREKGLPSSLRQSRCMADDDASEIILPDGRTGRCEHFSEDMITGDIRDGHRDEEVTRRYKAPLDVPECGSCVLFPICRKLQMCVWNQNSCAEVDRHIAVRELAERVQAIYKEHKNGGEKHEAEE